MRCPMESGKGAEMVLALAAGRLDVAERETFEQHMAECEACRRMAEAQTSVWSAMDEWAAPAVADSFDARLMARIATPEPRRWWQLGWDFGWRPALPVGAACLALLGVFLLHNPWPQVVPPVKPVAQVQQTVDVDQVESTLDDLDMLNQLDAPASPPHDSSAGS